MDVGRPRAPATAAPLSLHLQRERGGSVLAREPVERRDLVDVLAEYWFELELRAGRPVRPLAEVETRVEVVVRDDPESGRYCTGFHLSDPDAPLRRRFFPFEILAPVASRRARQLLADGVLASGELYFYGLCEPDDTVLLRGPEGRGGPSFAPLALERVQAGADPVAPGNGDDYPVFYTRAARASAERIARKGAARRPAVETGGLLAGPLCRCPDSGEVFAVVTDVIEATDSEHQPYSLTYSGSTWTRIQAVMKKRRQNDATRHHRLLGQVHGHNFLPADGAEPCEACALVATCTRSSALLSEDDRTWCRAVFSAEPWQLSQVFGLDARSEPTERFYGQRRGELLRRGYHVIDDVDPEWFAG